MKEDITNYYCDKCGTRMQDNEKHVYKRLIDTCSSSSPFYDMCNNCLKEFEDNIVILFNNAEKAFEKWRKTLANKSKRNSYFG